MDTFPPVSNTLHVLPWTLWTGACISIWNQIWVELLGHTGCLSSTLVDSKRVVSIYNFASRMWELLLFHIMLTPAIARTLNSSLFSRMCKGIYLIVVWTCISIISNKLSIFPCVCRSSGHSLLWNTCSSLLPAFLLSFLSFSYWNVGVLFIFWMWAFVCYMSRTASPIL